MSKIEWTGKTWNLIGGCWPKSAGCVNCYAVPLSFRLASMAEKQGRATSPAMKKYIGTVENGRFTGLINLDFSAVPLPYSWKKPSTIFVQSMGDLLHRDVPDYFLHDVFQVMNRTQRHTYQILTKRAERLNRLSVYWSPNIWAMVSVEDQQAADLRMYYIINSMAAVKGLSCEPLLGDIQFDIHELEHLDFVIVGGESGHKARPMHPDWVRSIRDQCVEAGVKFFFKQWGEYIPHSPDHTNDYDALCTENPYHTTGVLYKKPSSAPHLPYPMVKVGKKKAGRMLDGREWNELPPTTAGQ